MNMNQFTQKSLAAIQGAQDIAQAHGNQQIEQEHLLLALVSDQEGFIPQLLTAMGMTVPSFQAAAADLVNKLPKVSGGSRVSAAGRACQGHGAVPRGGQIGHGWEVSANRRRKKRLPPPVILPFNRWRNSARWSIAPKTCACAPRAGCR